MAKQTKEVTVEVASSFEVLRSRILSGVKAEGAPGALDVLQSTRTFVVGLVLAYRAAIDAGKRSFPEAGEFNGFIKELVDTLTRDAARQKDVRVMVTSGRYWGLNLISPSVTRREQAEASRAQQAAKKGAPKAKAKKADKGKPDRDAQMIALAVTNARRRGVAVDAIVAALDALK